MLFFFFNMLSKNGWVNFLDITFLRTYFFLNHSTTVLEFFSSLKSRCSASTNVSYVSKFTFRNVWSAELGKLDWKFSLWFLGFKIWIKCETFHSFSEVKFFGNVFDFHVDWFFEMPFWFFSLSYFPLEAFFVVLVVLYVYY